MQETEKSTQELLLDLASMQSRISVLEADRGRFEVELSNEKEQLHILLDSLPDTIYFKDTQSRFTLINLAQAKALGLSFPGEAIGKTDFDFFSPEHANIAFSEEQEIIKTGAPLINKIEKAKRIDNSFLWFSTTKVPILDKNGIIAGTVGVSRDITAMKEYENALHKAKTELELHVAERTKDLKTVNDRLEHRVAQLDFLNKTSFELSQLIQMEQLLPAILGTFVARFSDSTASICVLENEVFRCAHAIGELNCLIGRKASEQALEAFHHFAGQKPVIIENWTEDIFLSQYSWPALSDYPCYIAIPLYADNKILALVQIFARQETSASFEQEQSLIATLAAHAATCLLNALHYRELAEKVRIDAELDAARNIQSLFTPQTKPHIQRIDVKGVYLPAYEVGGDYLDYFQNESGDWVIVIADVCGKGIPAALLMTMLRSTFRVEGRRESSARNLLCSVNDFMIQNFDDRSFVTALVLIVKKDGSSMKYSRAGHPLLVHCKSLENSVCAIPVDGLALGIVADGQKFRDMITEVEIPFVKDDCFIMYTDGLIDATSTDQTTYGLNRLGDTILRCKDQNVETLLASILKDVETFSGHAQSHDDLTMLAIRVTG